MKTAYTKPVSTWVYFSKKILPFPDNKSLSEKGSILVTKLNQQRLRCDSWNIYAPPESHGLHKLLLSVRE